MPPRKSPVLHGEAGAATLCSPPPDTQNCSRPVPLRTYRYIDRNGERTASFPVDSSYDVSGSVKSASSGALADYQDKLKAIALREKGLEKSEVAQRLERPERWVQRWWRENPKLLQRPAGANDIVMQRASLESFRDLEIHRGFVNDGNKELEAAPGELLRAAVEEATWKQAKVLKRNADTGALDLAYDSKGATINAGRQVSDYKGGISCIDRVLQRAFSKVDIRDPSARIFMNYYADGQCRTGVHRHDFWTALVSLGADRILTVDNRPVIMRDGDMVVFGTQNHGVPPMPDVTESRVSLVIFFYPDHDNLERRQWQTITEDMEQEEGAEVTAVEPIKSGIDAQSGQLARRGVDTGFNLEILWGEGGEHATNGNGRGVAPKSATEALKLALNPEAHHGQLFDSPNASQWLSGSKEAADVQVKIFTAGVGSLTERDFFERLSRVGISQLWDLRAPDAARGCPHYSQTSELRQRCAARQISLRTVPLGRRDAGTLAQHLHSEEGLNTLQKIVSAAQTGILVAVLGAQEDWRSDGRGQIADMLTGGRFGALAVHHLRCNGGCEQHQPAPPPPDPAPAEILETSEGHLPVKPRTAQAKARQGEARESDANGLNKSIIDPVQATGKNDEPEKPLEVRSGANAEKSELSSEPPRRSNRWNRSGRST